ncbi:AAA family ATPase [Alkalibacillus silvisoli]|uniref:AAA family ATPase n=1 Tax=Alkalibacillus silvisoli TaxID=392823 RepID=A0ABN1A9U2_9BACI
MYFKRLEVVSFGKWKDETIELNEGFNYLYGPNESGKSSIRMFITYVLFGLSPKDRERYMSIFDGQLGGRLIIAAEDDDYVIERFQHRDRGKRVGYFKGEKLSEEEVQKLLQNVDHYLFESIFSFQDRDLYAIRHKQTEDIGKVLFNLGLTGSDYVLELEQELAKESGKLFKKQGRKPPINEKLIQLKSINEEIEKVHERERNHQALYQEAKHLEQDIAKLKEQDLDLHNRINQAQMLFQAKSSIEQVQRLDQEMSELLSHSNLTEDVIERYDEVKEKRQEYDERARVLMSKISSVKEQRNRLMEQSKSGHFPFSLEEVNQWTVEVEQKLQQKQELVSNVELKQSQLLSYLQTANIQLTEEEIRHLELSKYTKETWSRLAKDVHANSEKLSELERRKRIKLEELKELEHKQVNVEKQMQSSLGSEAYTDELEQLKQKQASFRAQQQMQSHTNKQKSQLQRFKQMLFWLKWGVVSFSGIAIGLVLSEVVPVIDFSWSFAIAAIGLFIFILLHRQMGKVDHDLNQLKTDQLKIEDYDDVEKRINGLEKLKAEESRHHEQLKESQMRIDYLNGEIREVEAERLNFEQQLEADEQKRVFETEQLPLLEAFELEQWEEVFQLLTEAQASIQRIDQYKHELDQIQQSIDQLDDQLKRFLSYYVSEDELNHADTYLQLVRHYLKHEQNVKEQIKHQHSWANELEGQLQELKEANTPYEKELQNMLSETNIQNEETLGQAVEDFETYQEKDEMRQEAIKAVQSIDKGQADSILKQSYNWIEIETKLSQDRSNKEEVLNQLDEKRQHLADCSANIRQLEEDGKLSDLIHEKSMIEGEIMTLAKEWAIYQTAKGLLQDTKARYQYEYLPKILAHTSKLFSEITNGAYQDVQFSKDESLIAQHRDGKWFDVRQLSEGTADQLYIALRLALNESLSDAQGFPFVLDDAFVHFDESRRQQMMKILLKQTKKQQLIYFACEPDQFKSKVHTISLANGQPIMM